MNTRPWYKRFPADFVHGCLGLSLEQKGAYSLCLDLIYDRGAPIPDDPRWLAGVCGCSMRKWSSIRSSLIAAGKLVAKDGLISNARAEKEIASASETARKHVENGSKGGNKSAESRVATNEIKDLGQARLDHTRSQIPDREKESKSAPSGASEGRSAPTDLGPELSAEEAFWKLAGEVSKLGIARSRSGQLAKLYFGDFEAALATLRDVAGAKLPGPYLGKIIVNLKSEQAPESESEPRHDGLPDFVRSAKREGVYVQALPGGRWRIGGQTYDSGGVENGW